MGKRGVIAGLEIGRRGVRIVAGEVIDGAFHCIGASRAACSDGVKNGTVINLDSVTEAIVTAVEEIHQKTQTRITRAFANISGLHVKGEAVNALIALPQRGAEITQKNIDDLIESCTIVSVPLDRYLLALHPLDYILDGQDGITNPLGLCGSKLEAKVFIVTTPYNQVQNVIKTVQYAGLEVGGTILTILANAYAVVTDDDRDQGVAVIDCKTDFTEVSIFQGGDPVFFTTIPKGQQAITDRIAETLAIPLELAEELKVQYAFLDNAQGEDRRNQETIPLEWMGRSQGIVRRDLNAIVGGQLDVLATAIRDALQGFDGLHDIVKKGMVITGGCTAMEGYVEYLSARLGFTLRQGCVARGLDAWLEGYRFADIEARSEEYAVALGLLRYGLLKSREIAARRSARFFKRVVQKTGEVLSDYF